MLTKNHMAQVIVSTLYNMREMPAADHHEVKRWAKMRKVELEDNYNRALRALESIRQLCSTAKQAQ